MTIETKTSYPWSLPDQDVVHLAAILEVPTDKVKVRQQRADKEAPLCHNCGRQLGLLDYVTTALERGAHEPQFLKHFFVGGNMSEIATPEQMEKVLSVKHNVNCYNCGEKDHTGAKWDLNPLW